METKTCSIMIHVPMHASNEDIAAALRHRAGLFAGMSAKDAGSRDNTDHDDAPPKKSVVNKKAAPVEEPDADEEDDFAPKKKSAKAKAAAAFEDDADDDDGKEPATDSDDDEEGFDAPPAKKAASKKAPKLTSDDVNDACKAKAKDTDRKTVLAILKKKFKVESVSDLKPEQYAACIEAMTGE